MGWINSSSVNTYLLQKTLIHERHKIENGVDLYKNGGDC